MIPTYSAPPDTGRYVLTLDLDPFPFDGLTLIPAVCRVRLFEGPDCTPVVICSERDDNQGTSVTNAAEIIAAAVLNEHLPHRRGHRPPFYWIEHYPHPERLVKHVRHWGPGLDMVTFGDWEPRNVCLAGRWRVQLGEPRWTRIGLPQLLALLGDAVPADIC